MYLLKNAEIVGLWGRRNLQFVFGPDINFLIGPNGSGKTAVIRLIAAALSGDLSVLQLAVTRETNSIEKEGVAFSLDGEKILARGGPAAILGSRSIEISAIKSRLRSLVRLTWLNIYREKAAESRQSSSWLEAREETASSLEKSLHAETNAFVSFVFSNLLPDRLGASEQVDSDPISWREDRVAFEKILTSFGISDETTRERMNAFFRRTRKARQLSKESPHGSKIEDIDDALALAYSFTIHKIVEKWHEVNSNRDRIFAAQRLFEKSLSRLFEPKVAKVNDQNALEITAPLDAKRLTLAELSSGEKQMLLILGEALLQRSQTAIYLADEPELSLHISWQERLVGLIKQLNPHAQIIFATHSPDIIGKHRDRIFDLRES